MIRFVLISFLSAIPSLAFAQTGSAGGSIGNDEKSLSGTMPGSPSADRSTGSQSPQSTTPFDGTWVFKSTSSCIKSITTEVGKFVNGKLVASVGDGTINASGEYHYARVGKQPLVTVGKMSGSHGSGTWRHPNDKCHGTWTAERQ